MSRFSAHGQPPHYDDAADPGSVSLQEAALIRELRRLQRFLEEECDQERFRDRSICNATTDRPVVRAPSEDHLSSRPTARLNDSSAGLDSIGGSRKRGRVHAVSRRQGARCARTQRCYSIRQASMRARVAFVMRLRCHGFLCRIASESTAGGGKKPGAVCPCGGTGFSPAASYLGTPARRLRVFGRPGAGHRIRWAGNCTQKKADARL